MVKKSIMLLLLSLWGGTLLAGPEAEQSPTVRVEKARVLFAEFVRLRNRFDPSLADLYADSAKIRVFEALPEGNPQPRMYSGTQWKAGLPGVLSKAKARNDANEYEEVRYQDLGDSVEVRAKRYSKGGCYWDRTWTLIIGRQQGGYKIIGEHIKVDPQAKCE